jgi:uncharacterized protein
MKIETHRIPSTGLELAYDVPADHFPTIGQMIQDKEVDFDGPISFVLTVVEEKDFFRVRGRITTTLKLACGRCLEVYGAPVDSRFSLTYSNKIPNDLQPGETGDIELTAEQIGVVFFEGDRIDFKEALQEQVVLAVPFRPLCGERCKGLCAGCGQNLNQAPCQCQPKDPEGPFSALKALQLRD